MAENTRDNYQKWLASLGEDRLRYLAETKQSDREFWTEQSDKYITTDDVPAIVHHDIRTCDRFIRDFTGQLATLQQD